MMRTAVLRDHETRIKPGKKGRVRLNAELKRSLPAAAVLSRRTPYAGPNAEYGRGA